MEALRLERPDAFRNLTAPSFESYSRKKASPPIPQTCGCVTLRTELVAIAASNAFPAFRRIFAPASVDRGWDDATMPCAEVAVERYRTMSVQILLCRTQRVLYPLCFEIFEIFVEGEQRIRSYRISIFNDEPFQSRHRKEGALFHLDRIQPQL